MFTFWFLRKYDLEVDACSYVDFFGPIVDVLATFTFTALALLLCWSVDIQGLEKETNVDSENRHWALRAKWVFVFFAVLVWVRFDEVVLVGLVQAGLFYLPFLVSRKPWRKFEIRDIMMGTLLVCCVMTFLMNTYVRFWMSWRSPLLIGILFGLLNLLAFRLVSTGRLGVKWILAIAIPHVTLLTIILSLGLSNKRVSTWIRRSLTVVVFLPAVLAIAVLSYTHPKPAEIGTGKNALDEIIATGNKIDNIFRHASPYPRTGPALRPFPGTVAQMKRVVSAYSPMTKKCRDLASDPAWLSVNYEWTNFDDFEGRIKERSAMNVLTTTMLVEGQLAFLENRIDDGLMSFRDAMDLNRQCGSGGLPMNTSDAMSRDHYMIEKFADFQNQLTQEQAGSFAMRLLEQCKAYESSDVLMERRIAWEDRVPKWHQRLALKYLAWCGEHPRGSIEFRMRRHETQLKLLALQLLVFAHEKSQGEFPESLDEIQFKELDFLRSDPFASAGTPFSYSKVDDKFILYSVGANGVDDNGGQRDATLASMRKQSRWAD